MSKTKQIREKEYYHSDDMHVKDENAFVVEATRQLSNKWTLLIKVYANVRLPDGRILVVDEQRALPGRQIGRKKSDSAKKESGKDSELNS